MQDQIIPSYFNTPEVPSLLIILSITSILSLCSHSDNPQACVEGDSLYAFPKRFPNQLLRFSPGPDRGASYVVGPPFPDEPNFIGTRGGP